MAKKQIVNEKKLDEVAGGVILPPCYGNTSLPPSGLPDPDEYDNKDFPGLSGQPSDTDD